MDDHEHAPERRLLKTREVAVMLGVTRQRVNQLANEGVLHPIQLVPGGDLRFRVEEIEELIAGRHEGGT